jgi:choline dehydrogenase-like flavoprotein
MKRARAITDDAGPLLSDYVVVGAGGAGAIVARRLADTGASVTLIESGRQRRGPLITIPGMSGAIHAINALQQMVTWPTLHRATAKYVRPHASPVARPDPRRRERDQRPGIRARQSAEL